MADLESTIEMLKGKARDSWSGRTGEERAETLEKFLRERLAEYSQIFGVPQAEILAAWESKRDYSAINYYQDSKFPKLDGVRLFKNLDDLKAAIPSKKFRCPSCAGESTDPYTCNTGIVRDGKKCDWKAFGLFKTLGQGLRFTFTENFLEVGGQVDEIFMPVDLETEKAVA